MGRLGRNAPLREGCAKTRKLDPFVMSNKPKGSRQRACRTSGAKTSRTKRIATLLGLTGLLAAGGLWIGSPFQGNDTASAAWSEATPAARAAWDTKSFQNLSASERNAEISRIVAQKVRESEERTAQARAKADEAARLVAETQAALKDVVDPLEKPANHEVADAAQVRLLAAKRKIARERLSKVLTARVEAFQKLEEAAERERVAAAQIKEAARIETARLHATDQANDEDSAAGQPVVLASLGVDSIPVPGVRPKGVPTRVTATPDRSSGMSSSQTLAYAPADITPDEDADANVFSGLKKIFNGNASNSGGLPGRGSGIAVYDISAATVHMPDGTQLEAHSGIGHMMDNPKYAYTKNLGPTPPNVYKLRMREKRFHGVEAIRMLPKDLTAMRGRDGMLTHTNLLRGRIGSHGCVAFTDYNKFLSAFKRGKVHTLVVVPQMKELPTYMAML